MSERRNDSVDAPMLGALFGAESSSGSESDDESSGFAPPPAAPWHADADAAEPPPRSAAGDPQRDAETALVAGGASVRLRQRGADLACKGGVCWGAARALCALFAANPARADLAGRRVLELGAGTGAVGLWIALRYPTARVTLTDLPEALPLIRANAALNGVADRVRVAPLAFGDPVPSEDAFDVVVGSDLLYSVQCEVPWRQLAATLATAPRGCTTWLAIQERYGCRVRDLGEFFALVGRASAEIPRGDVAKYAGDLGAEAPLRVVRTQ